MPQERKHRRRPRLEVLETRLPLNATSPVNSIGTSVGSVQQPRGVSSASVTVVPRNLTAGRSSTLFGIFVQPAPGSNLAPRIIAVEQNGGQKLAVKQGRPFVRGRDNGEAAAFVKVSKPGPLTILVGGQKQTTGAYQVDATLAGDANGDGTVNLDDLTAVATAYEAVPGDANYNPAADFNQNGIVNLYDAKAIEQNIPLPNPKEPLQVTTYLLPADQAHYRTPRNSGGATSKKNVTILGHTVPGSIVLFDGDEGFFTFDGGAAATDASGNFSIKVANKEGINNNTLLILDPRGQQTIRSFPIFWLPFAAPGSKLH